MGKRKKTAPRRILQTLARIVKLERLMVYGVALTLFAVPLLIWPGATEYGYTKTIAALVAVSLLSALWAIHAWRKGTCTLLLPWITIPFLAFVIAALLSLIHAINGRVVIQSLTLLLCFFQLFFLIANIVKEKRDVILLLLTFLSSVSLISLYGLLQYLGIMPGPFPGSGLDQAISTLGNREYIAAVLCCILLPAVVLLLRLRSRVLKCLTLLLIAFNFGTLMLLQQTGAVVALVLSAVALLIGWLVFRPIEPIRRSRAWLVGLIFLLAVTFLIEAPSGPLNSVVGLSADGSSWIAELWARNSGRVRSWDWWIGLEMFKAHPWVGVGLGNYKLGFIPYKAAFLETPRGAQYGFPIPRAAQAHNEYVQGVAETGILGSLAILGFLITLGTGLWLRVRRNPSEADRLDLLLFSAGIVAVLAHAVVSFPAHLPASSLAVVLLLGLAWSETYGPTASRRVSLKRTTLRVLSVCAVVGGFAVSVLAVRDLAADLLLQRGIYDLQVGEWESALQKFGRSLGLDFAPRQTYYYLGATQMQMGRKEEALQSFERCFTRFVDESVYIAYAQVAVDLNRTRDAKEKLEILLASNPSRDFLRNARYLMGVVLVRDGDYEAAQGAFESLVKSDPGFVTAMTGLGEVYMLRGLLDSARTQFEKALSLLNRELAAVESELSSAVTMALERYGTLRTRLTALRAERDFVLTRLDSLGQS